ncbi:TetR/AcrR family transcriptional regulator [Mycobacterium sp.]|uniref:TetR/AcrR family transcriptional regulator n=1 Tax=Mycobacterium sp. TaxID=1785 RepID=UPI003D0E9DAA
MQEAKRRAIVEVLIRAAQDSMITHGLDVTVDAVAACAGVNRSTVFRYFSTREELLAAAVRHGARDLEDRLPPLTGGDWRPWLHDICTVIHIRAAETAHGIWDLTARRDLSPQLSTAATELRDNRVKRHRSIAHTLWEAAGGAGPLPPEFGDVVAAHLSPLFTITVLTDLAADPHAAARLAETSITTALTQHTPPHSPSDDPPT